MDEAGAGRRASSPGARRRAAWARGALGAAILALVLGLVWLAHRYLLERLVFEPGVPEPLRTALALLVAALGAAMVLQPAAERLLPLRTARLVAWPAYVWMGALFLGLCLTLASDALLWLMGAAFAPGEAADPRGAAQLRALAVSGIAALATAVGVRGALRGPVLRRLELRLARWPAALDGFRIAQISDIHVGPLLGRRFAEELTARVNALGADLVAVTGDLVDGSVERLRAEVAPFAGLRARHGVYFVSGNHDWYSGIDPWLAAVRELGFRVLRNERVEIGDAAGRFDLAGVDDHRGDWRRSSPSDLGRALAGRDPARALVLLAHDPTTFAAASRQGVDLQLSGHTHGGQIWPFRWFVRIAVPWVEGLHERGGSRLYVSRGTGFWGPPLRLLAPAEITEITLRSEEARA
jgi:predicted MPP superfamily phosphohydrolase